MKRWRPIVKLPSWLLLALLLAGWEAAVRLYEVPAWLLPAPSLVVRTLGEQIVGILPHLIVTLSEAGLGFVLAIMLALVLAFILDNLPSVKKAVEPLLVASQTIPVITIAPLIIIWLGYGLAPKVAVVILVCFFPVVVNLLQGLATVDPDLVNLFRTMGANRAQIFRLVKMPAALPALFSGIKIAATYCLMAAIIGEWLGAREGLGYYMVLAQKSFYTDRVFAVIILIAVVSLLLYHVINWLERRLIPWNYKNEGVKS